MRRPGPFLQSRLFLRKGGRHPCSTLLGRTLLARRSEVGGLGEAGWTETTFLTRLGGDALLGFLFVERVVALFEGEGRILPWCFVPALCKIRVENVLFLCFD